MFISMSRESAHLSKTNKFSNLSVKLLISLYFFLQIDALQNSSYIREKKLLI